MRIAAIDIGTNTTLLTIAKMDGRTLVPMLERAEITRLGRNLSQTGVIGAEGLAATCEVLKSYVADCRRLGVQRLRAVGTAAMRSAENADAVRAAFAENGVEVEIISGEQEAALTFLSAVRDFGHDGRPLAVIDVGGGSTEVTLGSDGEITWRKSFPVGAVKAKELWMPSDPPTAKEVATTRRKLDSSLGGIPSAPGHTVVAVAGTPTTLAAIKNGIDVASYSRDAVHGTVLSDGDLNDLLNTIVNRPLTDRYAIRGLEPKRADVIDTGAMILLAVMDQLGAKAVTVSDGGVRWGVLWEMMDTM